MTSGDVRIAGPFFRTKSYRELLTAKLLIKTDMLYERISFIRLNLSVGSFAVGFHAKIASGAMAKFSEWQSKRWMGKNFPKFVQKRILADL